jgi:hypothetical protein
VANVEDFDEIEFQAERTGNHVRAAVRMTELAQEAEPGLRAEFHLRAGEQWMSADDPQRAADEFSAAIADGGATFADPRVYLARALTELDRGDEARELLNALFADRDAVTPRTCDLLAELFTEQGDLRGALEWATIGVERCIQRGDDAELQLLLRLRYRLRADLGLPEDDYDHVLEASAVPGASNATGAVSVAIAASTVSVSIYLGDARIHEQVELAVEEWLASAHITIDSRDEPVLGSWFRQLMGTLKEGSQTPAGREAILTGLHVADSRLVQHQDAYVTSTLLQSVGPVLQALQPTKDAVVRAGALLIIKIEWMVQVHQLTAAQQAILDHRPNLAASPAEIIAALQLGSPVIEKTTISPTTRRDGGETTTTAAN